MAPDVVLPDAGMDGLEVRRARRRTPETAGIPVLLATARAEVANRPEVWPEVGASGAILKPYSPAGLVAQVEARLGSGR